MKIILSSFTGNQSEIIKFETLSGILTVKNSGNGLAMDFPLNPSQKQVSAGWLERRHGRGIV